MLLAYDHQGTVIATLDFMCARDDAGEVIGLIDFAAHEFAGGEMTDVWTVEGAKGSKVWPEWLGASAHEFKVELRGPAGNKHAAALVHRESGHRRERAAIESAIQARITAAQVFRGIADIRDLVGGPTRPLHLDAHGQTAVRSTMMASPRRLPRVSVGRPGEVQHVAGNEAVGGGGGT